MTDLAEEPAGVEPTKPSKVPSVGFDGAHPAPFAEATRPHQPDPIGVAAQEALEAEALAWLRRFIGEDVVPVAAVQFAARSAGMYWSVIEVIAANHLVEWDTEQGRYWKFPKYPNRRLKSANKMAHEQGS